MTPLRYDGERYIPGQAADNVRRDHERRYQHVRALIEGQRILDVACGSGFGVRIMSPVSPVIVGVDYSFAAVSFAKRKYMRTVDSGVQADASVLPFADSSFDAVVSFETIEHLVKPIEFLQEVRRVLRPNCRFYISTPVKKTDRLDRYHVHEYTIHEFTTLLSRFFLVENVEGQRFMFSPFFSLFSLDFMNTLKNISLVKQLYRRSYGKDEIKPLDSARWRIPNFILVSCRNEQ